MLDYISKFKAWVQRATKAQVLVAAFFALGLVGLTVDGVRGIAQSKEAYGRPQVAWREAVQNGLAVSFNALEKEGWQQGRLPAMNIRGAVFDWRNHDWIIWGDEKKTTHGLPADALSVAVRAVVTALDSPGVDIRPTVASKNGIAPTQKVTYFGGVESTIVGDWFFHFDYWMKSAALGHASIPVTDVASYWDRVANVANATSASQEQCRFWLKNDDFTGVEDASVFTFQNTPLRVCAERLNANPPPGTGTRSATAADVAELFAQDLTACLGKLNGVAPVSEIEEFAKMMAAVTWLSKVDPYRDLSPWKNLSVQHVATTKQVQTLRREANFSTSGSGWRYSLELSGGVSICPQTTFSRSADGNLRKLGEVILRARPNQEALKWNFSFQPNN